MRFFWAEPQPGEVSTRRDVLYTESRGFVSLWFRDPELDPQASGMADFTPDGVTIRQEVFQVTNGHINTALDPAK